MSRGNGLGEAGREIQTLIDVGVTGNLSDGQLLDRFIARREEAVFRAILLRHGPMVWGVCRRILGNHHDAEDAFQATCLVLARKASSVSPREKVGPWLYGVASQTALKARQIRAKRRLHEGQGIELAEASGTLETDRAETSADLDRELSRLPEKYRVPIVLCELEGRSHKEAAETLGWPIGTVSGRLSRAKTLLANRLTRGGTTLTGGALASLLVQNTASAALPGRLIDTTARAAVLAAVGQVGSVSLGTLALTSEVLGIMMLSNLKTVGIGLIVGLALGAGGFTLVYQRLAHEHELLERRLESRLAATELQKTEKPVVPQSASKPASQVPNLNQDRFGGGPNEPLYMRVANLWFVIPPKKGSLTIYDTRTKKVSSLELGISPEVSQNLIPVVGAYSGPDVVGLLSVMDYAPKITHLYIFDSQGWKWYSQELKEPAPANTTPSLGRTVAAYRQGRFVYAFSKLAKKWSILELPEGGPNVAPSVGLDSVSFEADGHVYWLDVETGEWKHRDLRNEIKAAIDAAIEADKKGGK